MHKTGLNTGRLTNAIQFPSKPTKKHRQERQASTQFVQSEGLLSSNNFQPSSMSSIQQCLAKFLKVSSQLPLSRLALIGGLTQLPLVTAQSVTSPSVTDTNESSSTFGYVLYALAVQPILAAIVDFVADRQQSELSQSLKQLWGKLKKAVSMEVQIALIGSYNECLEDLDDSSSSNLVMVVANLGMLVASYSTNNGFLNVGSGAVLATLIGSYLSNASLALQPSSTNLKLVLPSAPSDHSEKLNVTREFQEPEKLTIDANSFLTTGSVLVVSAVLGGILANLIEDSKSDDNVANALISFVLTCTVLMIQHQFRRCIDAQNLRHERSPFGIPRYRSDLVKAFNEQLDSFTPVSNNLVLGPISISDPDSSDDEGDPGATDTTDESKAASTAGTKHDVVDGSGGSKTNPPGSSKTGAEGVNHRDIELNNLGGKEANETDPIKEFFKASKRALRSEMIKERKSVDICLDGDSTTRFTVLKTANDTIVAVTPWDQFKSVANDEVKLKLALENIGISKTEFIAKFEEISNAQTELSKDQVLLQTFQFMEPKFIEGHSASVYADETQDYYFTPGDGNCAFSAAALAILENADQDTINALFEDEEYKQRFEQIIKSNDSQAFVALQQALAPIVRHLAVKAVEEYWSDVAGRLFKTLKALIKKLEDNQPLGPADSDTLKLFGVDGMDEILNFVGQEEKALRGWLNDSGKTLYLQTLANDGVHAGRDQLGMLFNYLKEKYQFSKNLITLSSVEDVQPSHAGSVVLKNTGQHWQCLVAQRPVE
ncbi:MAG: hypothetical protein ACON35_04200 [Candidatus Marinamargulisbacteria bacterium]